MLGKIFQSSDESGAPDSVVHESDHSEFFRDYENWRQENYFEKFRWASIIVIGAFFAFATFTSNGELTRGSLIPLENTASMGFEIPFLSDFGTASEKSDLSVVSDIRQFDSGIFWVIKSTSEKDAAFDLMEECAKLGVVTTYYESELEGEDQYHVILSRGFSSKEEAEEYKVLIPEQYMQSAWLALLDNTSQIKT